MIEGPVVIPFSFEVYPPRSAAAAAELPATIDALAAAGPEFISVTFGAGGSSRDSSLEALRYVRENTAVKPMAHLTCVGSSHAEAGLLIRRFLDAGITSFLALRGDLPHDVDGAAAPLGDLGSAGELVQLIHRVQAERVPYTEVQLPGLPHAAQVDRHRAKVTVAVAAFPNGHPRSRFDGQDVDALLAKQAAGATLAITQLFFEAEHYLAFVDRARAAGVTIPILPGVMPVTSASRLRRIAELAELTPPPRLLAALEAAGTDEQRFAVGVENAVALASAVTAGGAPGIHLYTFNRHEAVLTVLAELGLVPASAPKYGTRNKESA
ncbi:methylenetetrahydrofolate reductase [Subtercola vilae]|uniref:methylenetetrahydrofolate reductase n=1 Tax=Subtercola vilae TaxID=2056433 RepID=UPI001F341879|nr:methylenetetrahydrofolate reductase [Subtercola vilae]